MYSRCLDHDFILPIRINSTDTKPPNHTLLPLENKLQEYAVEELMIAQYYPRGRDPDDEDVNDKTDENNINLY